MAKYSVMGSLAVATFAVLVMAAALATLINVITAEAPLSVGRNCKRKCVEGQSLTCAFDFDIQRYQSYSWACKHCEGSSCLNPECIKADGVTRFITVVNKMLPGPSIEVCEGDTVRVTVKNYLPTAGVSIHWHGLHMKDKTSEDSTPHMDGQPGVTQCLIVPRSKFTYTFKANPAGTHFWHAQAGFQRADGVFGPMIVRSPGKNEQNSHLYDHDYSNHIIVLNDWTHMLSEEKFYLGHFGGFSDFPNSILVNGLGPNEGNSITAIPKKVPYQKFEVQYGKRYRFRMISAAFLNCPITVSVENHILTAIATDGTNIVPRNATSIVIHPGERWDFILNANQHIGNYWMSFMGAADCSIDGVYQMAILNYVDKVRTNVRLTNPADNSPSSKPGFTTSKPRGMQINGISGSCMRENICLKDLPPSESFSTEISRPKADVVHYLAFNPRKIHNPGYDHPFLFNNLNAPEEYRMAVPQINNYTFLAPSTPLLMKEEYYRICDADTRLCEHPFCECVHLIKIPLESLVDLVVVNGGSSEEGNVIHLHGHSFYILEMNSSTIPKKIYHTRDSLKKADEEGLLVRNLVNPIKKDTVAIPPRGYAILRFLADNPGFWTLESQLLFYSEAGMKVIFQVGSRNEIPNPPSNFPTCGDFR